MPGERLQPELVCEPSAYPVHRVPAILDFVDLPRSSNLHLTHQIVTDWRVPARSDVDDVIRSHVFHTSLKPTKDSGHISSLYKIISSNISGCFIGFSTIFEVLDNTACHLFDD